MKRIIKYVLLAYMLVTIPYWGCKKEVSVLIPSLSTLPVIDVNTNSAKSGGEITDDGGGSISSKGLVWSKYWISL